MIKVLIFGIIVLSVFVSSCRGYNSNNNLNQKSVNQAMKKNCEDKILAFFDRSDGIKDQYFIDLNDPYMALASSRLTLFTDSDDNWAVVLETIGYHNRQGRIVNRLVYLSNVLQNKSDGNLFYIPIISDQELDRIDNGTECIPNNIKSIKVLEKDIEVEHDFNIYVQNGIFDQFFSIEEISYNKWLRYVSFTEKESLHFSEEQLKKDFLPASLKKLICIEEWHHKPYNNFERNSTKPSTYETYQMIAKVLCQGDTSIWKPSLEPNSHWANWQMSGGL